METWITSTVRRTCRRKLVTWGIVAAAAVLIAAAQQRYIYNCVSGPFAFGAADLDQIRAVDASPKYYVRVTGSEALDTGIKQISIRKRGGVETSRSVSAQYYALVIGDRLLLVKGSHGLVRTVEGSLEPLPFDVAARLFAGADGAALRPRFYAFYLNDASFRDVAYGEIIAALVLGFLFLRMAVPAWRRMKDVSAHPAVSRVNGWGDPASVAVAAEREFQNPRFQGNDWRVGDDYLIRSTFFSFDILRFADLLWGYKRVTKHSINFIPTGKSYDALLICYGGRAEVKGPEQRTDELLAFAAQRAPWAVFGYSDELLKLFNTNTDGFCAAIEQRKQDLRAGAARA